MQDVPVQSDYCFLWQAREDFHFESIFLEHLQRLIAGDHHTLKGLLLLDDLLNSSTRTQLNTLLTSHPLKVVTHDVKGG